MSELEYVKSSEHETWFFSIIISKEQNELSLFEFHTITIN